jgi:hypothetical protein
MSATTVEVTLRVKATEVFTAAEAPAAPDDQSRTLTTGGLTLTARRNATTTPKVDKPPVSLTITLGGSPTTIDLTAVAGLGMPPGLRTLDMTGAKVIDAVLRANATNVAPINVAPGAAPRIRSLALATTSMCIRAASLVPVTTAWRVGSR